MINGTRTMSAAGFFSADASGSGEGTGTAGDFDPRRPDWENAAPLQSAIRQQTNRVAATVLSSF
jgi:hypothetical protein